MTCTKRRHSVWTTCRCPDCQRTRYRQTKMARHGRYQRVPSDVAAALIDDWTRQGYSPAWIATAAGLSKNYVQGVVSERRHGRDRSIGPAYAAKIAAADLTAATNGQGPALGARRRLQGLARIGWTVEQLERHSGVKFTTIAAIQRGATERITAARAATVTALWADLSATPGPSAEAARRAAAKGWAAPAAWDDIDNPHETPEVTCSAKGCIRPVSVKGMCTGHYTASRERRTLARRTWIDVESLRDLADWGETTQGAADRLGVQRDSIVLRLARLGDDVLTAKFARNDADWELVA